MNNSKNTIWVLQRAYENATMLRHEFITPEHVLWAIAEQLPFQCAFEEIEGDETYIKAQLEEVFASMETVPDNIDYDISCSEQYKLMMSRAIKQAQYADINILDVPQIVSAILTLDESMATYILRSATEGGLGTFMASLIRYYETESERYCDMEISTVMNKAPIVEEEPTWKQLVTCMNDTYKKHNPLIGRERELERTIQVLCRKDKNNPLHVGEPGVGKTALIYGLTGMIERGEVPARLKGAHIYMMDLGTMLAGTQFRGDFENRIEMVMEGLSKEENPILYIDEIHNLVGAGRVGNDASLDASNMLKPYLENGKIRFIGSTTYEEYNRYFAKQKSLIRRFQQIDISEPSIDESIHILNGLKNGYEKFHGVKYSTGAIEFAVRQTAQHITDRFLPDKAIDLIDEAGAYRETHPLSTQKRQTVDQKLMADILAKMCKIDATVLKETSNENLSTLESDIRSEIFEQDKAVNEVVEAVQMAKAGLGDEEKPLANLLFVGPTGVGKTEVAKVLSQRLGVKLVRFDMSEYAEKHTVAKLIGSPAGYVGYDDGGLLTDAIRKTPNCVLLFDEIEKAHPDIYNIFLQIMDYASLTDNHGQKADFRNVIVIMTSNAGAQYASRANVGFTGSVSRGEAMLTQVKKTFKPEFINRLTDIVVFNDMNRDMASLILDKKLARLQAKLTAKNVTISLSDDARELMLNKGFTPEYGAREFDRVIGKMLKSLLMREILFGKLKKGGNASVVANDGKLIVEC